MSSFCYRHSSESRYADLWCAALQEFIKFIFSHGEFSSHDINFGIHRPTTLIADRGVKLVGLLFGQQWNPQYAKVEQKVRKFYDNLRAMGENRFEVSLERLVWCCSEVRLMHCLYYRLCTFRWIRMCAALQTSELPHALQPIPPPRVADRLSPSGVE